MRGFKYVLLAAAIFFVSFAAPTPKAQAQISFSIGVGEPACAYGYYGYAPYRCAPYGYYGPEWFSGGHFIGAGRWNRGGPGFYGHVNRAYDPHYGYHGPYPARGEAWHEPEDHWQSFHSTHYSDPRGHYHTEEQHSQYVHH